MKFINFFFVFFLAANAFAQELQSSIGFEDKIRSINADNSDQIKITFSTHAGIYRIKKINPLVHKLQACLKSQCKARVEVEPNTLEILKINAVMTKP